MHSISGWEKQESHIARGMSAEWEEFVAVKHVCRIYTQYIKNYQIEFFMFIKQKQDAMKKMQFCNKKELLDIKKINFNRMIGR